MAAQRKILILTNRIPWPLKDGGNLAMNAMIEGYHNAGWQVYVLAMNTSRHHVPHEQLEKLFKNIYAFEWVNVDNHLKTIDILKNYLFSGEPEHAIRFYKKEFQEKIVDVLNSFKPDVVQIESVYLSTYLPAIRDTLDVITVLRAHNIEYHIWQSLAKKNRNWFKRRYLNNLADRLKDFERDAWKEYNLLLAISEKDAQLIERTSLVANLLVAPFGIDIDKIKPGQNEKWVGYHIGAMDWMANSEGVKWFLEKAWPKVRRAVPEFEFFFAGRNMPTEFKKMEIKGVHCMSEVASAEDFIADKKILIVPLLSGSGIRVKILEAMAARKVVIATSVAIKGIEAMPGVHFLQSSKPEDFARSIKWCMENKDAAEKMATNAYELVKEKYEYRKVINNVIGEIDKLFNEHDYN